MNLPRLLAGVGQRPMPALDAHLEVHGALDVHRHAPGQIIDLVDAAGLRGHGGAAFPAAVKMRAVASRRKPKVLVANATEGEPASKKDRVLLRDAPHLVLDGVALAARAIDARQAIIAVSEADARGIASLDRALGERGGRDHVSFEVVLTPERYLSGQETALVSLLNGGPGLPTFGPRPFERGVRGRPTLVQNAETLAHMALIGRHGAGWFRQLGTDGAPGSALVTLSGAVSAPGVYEIDPAMGLAELLDAGGAAGGVRAVLVGGYFGSWLPSDTARLLRLAPEDLRKARTALGAGVIVALPDSACPVAETARVTDWFLAESAGQCGPCLHGLGAIADTVQRLASGTAGRSAYEDLARWTSELPGRGACAHPDGAVRFMASALRVFSTEFADHGRHGPCDRCARPPVLPAPLPESRPALAA